MSQSKTTREAGYNPFKKLTKGFIRGSVDAAKVNKGYDDGYEGSMPADEHRDYLTGHKAGRADRRELIRNVRGRIMEEHPQAAKVRASHNLLKRNLSRWNPSGPRQDRVPAQHVFGKGRSILATFLRAYKDGQLKTGAGSDFAKESELAAKSTAARNLMRKRGLVKALTKRNKVGGAGAMRLK